MKGIRKINLSSLLGKLKLFPSAISKMSGKTKSTLIKAGLGLGMTGAMITGTAINLNQNTDAVIPSEQTQDANAKDDSATAGEQTDADKTDEAGSIDLSFLSDELNVTDIDMSSTLGERIEKEVEEASKGMEPVPGIGVDESGKPLTEEEINNVETKIEGDYFIAPDGTPWVSEEEYNRYIAGQNGQQQEVVTTEPTTTTGDSYYIAPDGSFWESEAAYQEYINGLNNTPEVTPNPDTGTGEDIDNDKNNSYKAPDGSYWDSEADYLEYIGQGQNNNNDNYYVAPDGSYWESEADYNNYMKGFSETVDNNGNTNENNNNNNNENTNSGYVAPDGSYWASEQDYIDYINSLNNNNSSNNTNNNNQGTNENDNTYDNTEDNTNNNTSSDYFVAPDGSVWASEQDYNDYMKSLTIDESKTK